MALRPETTQEGHRRAVILRCNNRTTCIMDDERQASNPRRVVNLGFIFIRLFLIGFLYDDRNLSAKGFLARKAFPH